jgi:hypothetical protein
MSKSYMWLALGLVMICVLLIWHHTVSYMFLGGVRAIFFGGPTQEDRREAQQVYDYILAHHSFSQLSRSKPGSPPVFFEAGSRQVLTYPMQFSIYDISDEKEQLRIVEGLRVLKTSNAMKPIRLRFYERENWIETGKNSAERGPENLLRTVVIN